MPDGAYYLKIVGSDLPSNPPSHALTNERISERFEIQNTPPRIENLRADTGGAAAKITFDGVSSGLAITRAQYSVDAGDWLIVFPARRSVRRAKGKLSDRTSGPRARPAHYRRANFRPLRQHDGGASSVHRGSAVREIIPAQVNSGCKTPARSALVIPIAR